MKETQWRYLYLRDPFQLQTWLEDLSLEGWELRKIQFRWGEFHRIHPRRIRYRLEPIQPEKGFFELESANQEDKQQFYSDLGWRLVGLTMDSLNLYAADAPDAPELHTDPEILKGLWRRERNRMLLRSALVLGIFLMRLLPVLYSLYGEAGSFGVSDLVRVSLNAVIQNVFLLIMVLVNFRYSWVRCQPYFRLCRGSASQYRSYPPGRWRQWVALGRSALATALLMAVPLMTAAGIWSQLEPAVEAFPGDYFAYNLYNLPENRELPYLNLEELDYRGELNDRESYSERANTFTTLYHSEVTQSTVVYPLPLQSLSTEYYHMRSPYFTQLLLEKLLAETVEAERIFLEGVDQAWRGRTEGEENPFLLFRRGERVLYLWCSRDLVDLYAQADAAVALLDRAAY